MTQIKYLVIPVLLSLFNYQSARACSCGYLGPFTEYAKNNTVISGKIKGYGPKLGHGQTLYQNMDVEILEVILGEFSHKTVKLLGDPGHLCRPYVDSTKYKLGSTFLITVSSDASIQPFMGCGESAVLVKDKTVYGTKYLDGEYVNYQSDLGEVIEVIKSDD